MPSEEGGAGRWAIDHLFLDQDGIPTIVEVKRSTDTRIRREVVGQMLDSAANAVGRWSIGPWHICGRGLRQNCESARLSRSGTVSLPFPTGKHKIRAVKFRSGGNEIMKVLKLK